MYVYIEKGGSWLSSDTLPTNKIILVEIFKHRIHITRSGVSDAAFPRDLANNVLHIQNSAISIRLYKKWPLCEIWVVYFKTPVSDGILEVVVAGNCHGRLGAFLRFARGRRPRRGEKGPKQWRELDISRKGKQTLRDRSKSRLRLVEDSWLAGPH